MKIIGPDEVHASLDFPSLIDALRDMFVEGCEAPVRHHHAIETGEPGPEGNFLLMPAWQPGGDLGIKIVTVFPNNAEKSLPAVHANVLLFDGVTGQPKAMVDGEALTVRRTAAASALAASYLARKDAGTMAMLGSGAMAGHLVRAHASVRPIKTVLIWNRTLSKAENLADELRADGFDARAIADRQEAVSGADIVTAATLSNTPLIEGAWLRPGTHVDLVGAFRADMRESDDEVMRRAEIYVDTRAGAGKEAGDVLQAIEAGAISADDVRGDLFDLCRGTLAGRQSDDAITVFKSVGAALEDLAAASLVVKRAG